MLFFFTFFKKVYALGIFYRVLQIIDAEEVWSNSCFCLFSTMIPGSQTSTYPSTPALHSEPFYFIADLRICPMGWQDILCLLFWTNHIFMICFHNLWHRIAYVYNGQLGQGLSYSADFTATSCIFWYTPNCCKNWFFQTKSSTSIIF